MPKFVNQLLPAAPALKLTPVSQNNKPAITLKPSASNGEVFFHSVEGRIKDSIEDVENPNNELRYVEVSHDHGMSWSPLASVKSTYGGDYLLQKATWIRPKDMFRMFTIDKSKAVTVNGKHEVVALRHGWIGCIGIISQRILKEVVCEA